MNRRLNTNFYSYLVVLIVALIVTIYAATLRYFDAKFIPLVIGIILTILAIAGLVKEYFAAGRKTVADQKGAGKDDKEEGWRTLIAIAWVGGYIAGICVIGLLPATAIFLASFMTLNKIRWPITVAATLATVGVLYVGFEVLLGIEMYRGLFFGG